MCVCVCSRDTTHLMSMARMTAHAFLTTRETADIATMVRGRSEHIRTHDGKPTHLRQSVWIYASFPQDVRETHRSDNALIQYR